MSTEQRANDALRAIVREPVELSDDGLDVVLAAIPHTPQQRGWLPPMPKWRYQSMFSATKLVVAGAIVAIFGGFLLSGVLTQPSDDRLPAVGASASATAQAEATEAATPEPELTAEPEADGTTTTPALLPGVDLVTEEIEPGVYRVLSDGIRDLVRLTDGKKRRSYGILDGNVVAGLDGSVWRFEPDGFFRLGKDAEHRWPKGISENFIPGGTDIEVGPDGTLWLAGWHGVPGKTAHMDIASYDGQAWSDEWSGAYMKRWASGIEVQQDGTVWMAWFTNKAKKGEATSGPVRAARLGDDGWEVLPGSVEAPGKPQITNLVVADAGGSDVWLMDAMVGPPLHRHDGEGWVRQETPDLFHVVRAAAGPDGTLWVRLGPGCPDGGCWGRTDTLARLDGGEWEVYDSSHGIPMMGDHYQGFEGFFEVAPDRSIWFNPNGDYEQTGTECDGVANFDGEAVASFLPGMCIYAMNLAPDGTVWLQAGEYRADISSGQNLGDVRPGPMHTYVITPEAAAGEE